jgi:hypothetical protein
MMQTPDDDRYHVRVSCGDRWLTYDSDSMRWSVHENKYRAKKVRLLIETADENTAVEMLISKNGDSQ